MTKNCLTLIGMPASGKSSVGVVLAKKTGRRFIDGDLLIQEQSGKLLKDLIAERGDDGFRALEDETLAALETENAVIAPGGSVIYGEKAMARLKALGKVIYLKLSYPAIQRRLGDLTARGVSIKEGQTLRDLYRERTVLYEKYADLVIDENGLSTPLRGQSARVAICPRRRNRKNSGEERGETMAKEVWRGGNMLYPVPAVMVSCRGNDGRSNLITVAWAGTVCSDPAMVSISVRPERFSHQLIAESGEFAINLTTEALVRKADEAGVRSGRDCNKWELLGLTEEKASKIKAPLVKESPVNLECRVTERIPLGTHDLFLAEVLAVDVDKSLMDEKGKFCLEKAKLVAYSHGEYYSLGALLGTYGYSVRKKG